MNFDSGSFGYSGSYGYSGAFGYSASGINSGSFGYSGSLESGSGSGSGFGSGSGSGRVSCSRLLCTQAQYFMPCTALLDSVCLNCSTCSIGKYLSGCSSKTDEKCLDCRNKYELCGLLNDSVSVYTSPGMLQSDCSWMCVSGYYRSGDMCRLCTASTCSTGQYRTAPARRVQVFQTMLSLAPQEHHTMSITASGHASTAII